MALPAPEGAAQAAAQAAAPGQGSGPGPRSDGGAVAEVPAAPSAGGRRRTGRGAWRGWRGRRPFWGGTLVLLGGAEILFTLRAPLPVVLHIGMQGLAGYLVPGLMVICGALILLNPTQRLFYSLLSVLLALGSWLTSNLGGFLLGMLLGLAGGCLTFGWLPDQPPRRLLRRRPARTRRSSAVRA